MARKLRVQYPGAIYHVMNRGDRREPIFKGALDRRRFLETLGQISDKTGWQTPLYRRPSYHVKHSSRLFSGRPQSKTVLPRNRRCSHVV